MNFRLYSFSLWLALLFAACSVRAAEPLRVEARLVWGTNDEKSPNTNHVAVDEALAKRLAKSPFKWKNYFEVNKVQEQIAASQTKRLKMSDHCMLDIKNLGDGRIEVKLEGEGKLVARQVEPLVDDWPLILSGNAKNDTAWLVVIQKVSDKPKAK